MAIHSSVRAPRSANGTSSASNSSSSQPAPTPSRSRPLLAMSIDAACLANITGRAQRQHEHRGPERRALGHRRGERERDHRLDVRGVGRPGRLAVGGERVVRVDRARQHDVVGDPEPVEARASSARAIAGTPSACGSGPLFGSLAPMRRVLNSADTQPHDMVCVKRSYCRFANISGSMTCAKPVSDPLSIVRLESVATHCEQKLRRRARCVRVKAVHSEAGAERDSRVRAVAAARARGDPRVRRREPGPHALSDVAKATDLAPATARRFVLTLVDLGYMRAEGRWFRLSPRVLELGRPYLASLTLPEIARPHLREFVADVRESSSIAILDGGDIVYVAHEAAKRLMSVQVTVGTRDPAFATSLGRVLIAANTDESLSASLADASADADHAVDDRRPRRAARRAPRRSAARASRWSTRSSRRGCARSPHRSTARTAR